MPLNLRLGSPLKVRADRPRNVGLQDPTPDPRRFTLIGSLTFYVGFFITAATWLLLTGTTVTSSHPSPP